MMRASTDVAAAYGLAGKPFVVVLAILFAIVLARSHLTYWAGRGVVRGAMYGQERIGGPRWWRAMVLRIGGPRWWRAMVLRIAAFAASAPARRGLALLHRFGPVAVTLAYLTVGVQTAVFAGAGLLRMPYVRFTLASVPGAAAWALIWATVGLGAVWAALELAARSPWALVAVLVVVAAGVAGFVVRSRRRAAARMKADSLVE